MERFITVAIHTYDKAIALRSLLEREGIEVQFRNVNIEQPIVSSGIRVRIKEQDLPLALRIIENRDVFSDPVPMVNRSGAQAVLVPIDFSDNSLKATEKAFFIAQAHGTSIMLLHTYMDPYVAGSMQLTDSLTYELSDSDARKQVQARSTAQMRHFTSRVKEKIKKGEIPAVSFDSSLAEGVPEDAINVYTKTNNPFLIVMGTRGSQRKEAELIGSVTAEVLDRCRFSVLALPEPVIDDFDINKIGKVLYFSNADQEDILAMDTLYRLFPDIKAKVTIMTIPSKRKSLFKDVPQAQVALCDYCRTNFPGYEFEIATLDAEKPVDDLRKLEKKGHYDLVVVPNKKKSFFSRFFNPSLAHKVLFAADVPMLVIPV